MITTDQTPSHDSSPNEFVALVVDNDLAGRLILRGLLEGQGGHVIEAKDSSAAKAVFGVCAPDIVVLSVTPETGGFEACAQIRALPNNVITPVLTILDLDDETTVGRALAAGAADYVTKPIHPVILRHRIRRLLQLHNIDAAILRAKREWETAFDAVSDLIILTDLHGKIIRCNLATIQHLETTHTELVGRDLKAVLLQDTGQELNLPFREPREMQFPSLPGWFEVRTFPGHLEGRWHTIVYILKDVTERKRLQESVQHSERRFKALVENISEGIQLLGVDGKTIYASPTALRITGYDDEYIGSSPFEYLHPDDVPQCLELFNQLSQQPDTVMTAEIRTRHKNGEWIWLEVTGHNLLTEPGIESILVHFRDITERKQDEIKFRQLSQAVEQSPISIVITNTAGDIEYVNPRFTQLTGYSFREVAGQNPRLLKSDQTPPGTFTQLWESIRSGREWQGEFINRKKSGALFIERASVSPVMDEKGNITHYLALKEEITERKQAEEALRLSQERFEMVAHATNDAVWDLNLSTGERWWNSGVRSRFGYSADSNALDQAWWEAQIHPDDRIKVLTSFQAALNGDGQFWSKEYRFRRSNGTYAYVFDRGYISQDEAGIPVRVIGAMMDLTDRKQSEDALRAREQQLEEVQHTARLGSWEWDFSTNIATWSDELYRLCDLDPRSITPSHEAFLALVHPDDRDMAMEVIGQTFQTHQPYDFDHRIITAKGRTRWLHGHGEFLKDQTGQSVRFRGTAQDITERKHMEEALMKSEELFSKAFHASPAPMGITRVDNGIIIDVNGSWERLFGYDRQAVTGRSLMDLHIYINPQDRTTILEQIYEQGKVINYEVKAKTKSEEDLIVLMSAQIVEIQRQACLMSTFYDITEQRRLHEAMLASQKLADLGTLAAGVAHEMNSPLQVITGLSQSLLRKVSNGGVEPQQLEHNLDVIQRNGWRCAEIVRSLHTYARNSGGSMEPADLNELVSDGLLLIEHQLKSWANISVQTILAENLPALICDRNQITQVLINLLTNARDAMPDGGEIMIVTSQDPKSSQLILQISDSGVGIPDAIRGKIFDPFFTTKPLGKGTGLGLSIVAGIVSAHGGTIDIESAPRQGTTFTMRFLARPPRLLNSEAGNTLGRFDDLAGASIPAAEQTIL